MELAARKVILITGGEKGIGAAIAQAGEAAGYLIVRHARAPRLPGSIAGDLRDPGSIERILCETVSRYGRLDHLVCNAAISDLIPFADLNDAEVFHDFYHLNTVVPFFLAKHALRYLQEAKGSILFMSSVAAFGSHASSLPYALSKAALNHLTRLLAREFAPRVRVNALCPGYIGTERTLKPEWGALKDGFKQRSWAQRIGEPEEVAQVALSLIENGFVTGTLVRVDGGLD